MFFSPRQLLAEHEQAEREEVYGDFEDLETGQKYVGHDSAAAGADNGNANGHPAAIDEAAEQNGVDSGTTKEEAAKKAEQSAHDKYMAKKERIKALFNASYDGGKSFYDEAKQEIAEQLSFNRTEFADMEDEERVQYEGFRAGLYVRIEITHVPCELVDNFDPHYPLILGSLNPNENGLGYMNIRLKKHRWHKKILKTRDPIVLSVGWRRFETIPLYAIEDHNGRNRLLKYTPEHMHCLACVYGQTLAG